MIKWLLFFLLIANVSLAQEQFRWGELTPMYGQSSATIFPSKDHAAVVIVENELTIYAPGLIYFTLEMNGIVVEFAVHSGDNAIPDTIVATPPPGYTVTPPSLILEEYETGYFYIDEYFSS